MVLYRSEQERELSRLQELVVENAAVDCQRIVRGYLSRKLRGAKVKRWWYGCRDFNLNKQLLCVC